VTLTHFFDSAATVNDLLRRSFPDSTRICYFFCEESDSESLSATTVLGSLLRQCLTLDTLPSPAEAEIRKLFANSEPEPDQYIRVFQAVSQLARTHFVVLDGIEECTKDAQRAILRVLGQFTSSASSRVTCV
jgi:hypothetical protein